MIVHPSVNQTLNYCLFNTKTKFYTFYPGRKYYLQQQHQQLFQCRIPPRLLLVHPPEQPFHQPTRIPYLYIQRLNISSVLELVPLNTVNRAGLENDLYILYSSETGYYLITKIPCNLNYALSCNPF